MKMSVKKSVKLSSAIAAVFLLAGMSQAMAQVAPTMQGKMACRSDAESMCSQFVGKPTQMQALLRDNKAKLSPSCRNVVEAHGGEAYSPPTPAQEKEREPRAR